MMRDDLLLAGVTLIRKLKRRAELMPEDEPLDAGTAIQLLKLAAIAGIRVQFFDDDPAQGLKAILIAGLPVALHCHLPLGNQSPRLPLLALGNNRLARVLKSLDLRPQRMTVLLQVNDALIQLFR